MKQGLVVLSAALVAVAILLPLWGQSEASEPRVWIPEYCGFKMGTIEFSMCVENEIPLTSMTFDVLYDEAVYPRPGICIDERAHGCFMNWASIVGGVRISMVYDSIEAGSGPLVFFRFDEPEGLECGERIEFTVGSLALSDVEGHSSQYENLTASLPVRYLGDVNEDCRINVVDVYMCAINAVIGLPGPLQGCIVWALDVDEDGEFSILDAIALVEIIFGHGYPKTERGEPIRD
jgi:hypothetical protein